MSTTIAPSLDPSTHLTSDVVVACPDARPPAYQAAIGLSEAGRLDRLVTGFYHRNAHSSASRVRASAPGLFAKLDRKLSRRRDPNIPDARVVARPLYDLSLAVENRVSGRLRHSLARLRTDTFDRSVLTSIQKSRPRTLLTFSDVASRHTLPFCRRMGIRAVLSMVHGEVREELEVLERERERSPEFFKIYLGDGPIDMRELSWLHARRLRDLELADLVLVPSQHIANRLIAQGTDTQKIEIIPYAADTSRFVPESGKPHDATCRFLFAGGITQRKGIKDLLDAWRLIKRPNWTLQILGGLPRDTSALEPYRDEFEWLGRVGHSEMPAIMASADVFVFPSLFEGSAVVTYEALACGLPSIVTAESGSVARDGLDGIVVPAASPESLALAMERLGSHPGLREMMSHSARDYALNFDWARYHQSLLAAVDGKEATSWISSM